MTLQRRAILAAPPLLILAACSKPAEPVPVGNAVEALSANLEDRANLLEAMASNQTEASADAEVAAAAAAYDNAYGSAGNGAANAF